MIPEAFGYTRARTVAEAILAMSGGARALAGGHSLVPALKLRLASEESLVDIGQLSELKGISLDGSTLVIGALTRHHDVATSADVTAHCACLAQAAGGVGDQMVRNRGTLGGSLAQNDPHGDLPAVMLAVGANITLQGPNGSRTVAADDFFVDYYETAREDDELITSVRIPGAQTSGAYEKFNRRAQDWAIIGAAVSKGADGWRVALTGAGPVAVRAKAVEAALASGSAAADAAAHASDGLNPQEGLDGSAEYKRHLACVLVKRALVAAGG